ncbi:glycosyltransferase family 2 protein [Hoylesella nanceiensis]|uniref:glycosyltransferase family 2 protein n=1 Tax=Hoylesella nanceiensis TaxID=425941 RepID=UPI0028EAEDD6|nr:glycosyltransferase family 2 protein [Hoylesella nanceiensis]
MSVAISIIVPIYKAEKTLRRALDSILAQTFTNYELILVNDGSPDNCPAICEEYAAKDPRIKLINKKNEGASSARNTGLEIATGDYTLFLDSDDYVDAEGLDKLYATSINENADITICDFYHEDEYTRKYIQQKPTSCQPSQVLKDLFHHIGGFMWNKLIRRSLYKKLGISYPKNISMYEDQYVIAQFLMHNIKIAYCPVAFYHYMYNSNSLSRNYNDKTYEKDKEIFRMFTTLLKDSPALQDAYYNKYIPIFTRAFWFGEKCFSSKKFQQEFSCYKTIIHQLHEPFIIKKLMFLACNGYYQIAHKILRLLFYCKRFYKRIKASIS